MLSDRAAGGGVHGPGAPIVAEPVHPGRVPGDCVRPAAGGHSSIPLERRMSVARALAHVGSTSYSAYLWHWPLLGYLAYTNVDFGVSRLDYALYFLILTGLVAATYHTVEKRRLSISVRASVVLLIAFVVAGRYLGTSPRDKTWFREEKQQILASAAYDDDSLYRGPGQDDREVRRAVRRQPRADGGGTVPALGTGTRLRACCASRDRWPGSEPSDRPPRKISNVPSSRTATAAR